MLPFAGTVVTLQIEMLVLSQLDDSETYIGEAVPGHPPPGSAEEPEKLAVFGP